MERRGGASKDKFENWDSNIGHSQEFSAINTEPKYKTKRCSKGDDAAKKYKY